MRWMLLLLMLAPLKAMEPLTGGDQPALISTGEKVDLKQHLVRGRYVLFDFYADWCGPCRKWDPIIRRFAEKYPDRVVVKKIDIKSWGTPVAIQHNIKRLPFVMLYSPEGKRKRKGHPREVLDFLKRKAKKW